MGIFQVRPIPKKPKPSPIPARRRGDKNPNRLREQAERLAMLAKPRIFEAKGQLIFSQLKTLLYEYSGIFEI